MRQLARLQVLFFVSTATLWGCMHLPDDGGSDQSLAGAAHAADHDTPDIAHSCSKGGEPSMNCADGKDSACCSGTCQPSVDPDPDSNQAEGILCDIGDCDNAKDGTYCSSDGTTTVTCTDGRVTAQSPPCDPGLACDDSTGTPNCVPALE
jgi:hypothetical protein